MLFTMRAMKTDPAAQSLGFFDEELRVHWMEATGLRTLQDFPVALVSTRLFKQACEAFAQQRQALHTEFSCAKPRAAG